VVLPLVLLPLLTSAARVRPVKDQADSSGAEDVLPAIKMEVTVKKPSAWRVSQCLSIWLPSLPEMLPSGRSRVALELLPLKVKTEVLLNC
jgi:hypothetical protein